MKSIELNNIFQDFILFTDLEFDNDTILQSSGLIYERKSENVFELKSTFDFYIKREKVGKYAEKYTGLTSDFLLENGIEFEDFKEKFNSIMSSLDLEKTLFVSHGAKNDRKVYKKSGIVNLPKHSYCTYKNAAKILKRENRLSLYDVSLDSGYDLKKCHDSYLDSIATIYVFNFLNKKEK